MPSTTIESNASASHGAGKAAGVYPILGLCALLVVAVFIVFGRTLTHSFLNFDDGCFVSDEPHVAGGVTLSGIAWASTHGPFGEWYPLSMLSHMIDCQLFGLAPAGHHLTNVLLHAATAVGLFLVLRRMTASLWPSALVAALFAIHPLRVESVAWIAERRDVLSGLLFVLILGAYDEYVRHPKSWARYAVVFCLLGLGLMAKAILMTVPPLLVLLDYWPLGRFDRVPLGAPIASSRLGRIPWRILVEKLPLLALSVAAALVTLVAHSTRPDPYHLAQRLANAAIACVAYLAALFWPFGLYPFYPHPEAGWPVWQVALASLLLATATVAVIHWRRSLPFLLVGWFWYLGMLTPVLGLTYAGITTRADRYTYLSQIGLYIALVWSALRLGAAWPARRWVFGIASAALLAVLAATAWRQTGYWVDDLSLWRHALECDLKNPTSHFMVAAALEGGDDESAAVEYERCLEMETDSWPVYDLLRAKAENSLGDIDLRKPDVDRAIDHFRRALKWDPVSSSALMSLVRELARQGNLEEAAVRLGQLATSSPGDAAEAYCTLADAQAKHGQTADALENYDRALEADDKFAKAHANLAGLLASRGALEPAIVHLRRAIEIEPDSPVPYYALARLLRAQGDIPTATDAEQRGLNARRRLAEAQNRRAVKLLQQGRARYAIMELQSATVTLVDFAPTYVNLGDVLLSLGRNDEAAENYQKALDIDPRNKRAKEKLAKLSGTSH